MRYFVIFVALFSTQAFAGVKIACNSETEMEYRKVNTLDNQTAKDEWQKKINPHSLDIELLNEKYILINGSKQPIVKRSAGVLYLTTSSKELPGTNKNQGSIVMVSLAINVAIPTAAKTTLVTKYFLSSEIHATATNYTCRYNN